MTAFEKKPCLSTDKVAIVYSVVGRGGPGLVFIHGGLAHGQHSARGRVLHVPVNGRL
jgi:hypothetical protein